MVVDTFGNIRYMIYIFLLLIFTHGQIHNSFVEIYMYISIYKIDLLPILIPMFGCWRIVHFEP